MVFDESMVQIEHVAARARSTSINFFSAGPNENTRREVKRLTVHAVRFRRKLAADIRFWKFARHGFFRGWLLRARARERIDIEGGKEG